MKETKRTPEGSVLRFFRERRQVSREDLGARAGVSQDTLFRWENGGSGLTRERLIEVLARIGVGQAEVDAALFAVKLGDTSRGAGGLLGARQEQVDLIEEAAGAVGLAAARATRDALSNEVRRQQAAHHRRWAQDVWTHMKGLSARQQQMVVELLLEDEQSWALAERMAQASVTAAADRASEALRLARLAVRLAESVPGDEKWRLRLLGYCEPFLANAFRVAGNLPAAGEAFAQAEERWNQGAGGDTAGVLDGMRRMELKASLLMCQGNSEEAISILDRVLVGIETERDQGRLLLMKARALEFLGLYEAANQELLMAEPMIDPQREPRLYWGLHLSLAVNYCHMDRYRAADALLPLLEAVGEGLGNALDSIRLLWLRSRILAGLGNQAEAIIGLSLVRGHLLSERIPYDFALASLELATLHLYEGQTALVRDLAEQMLWIFRTQHLHKEAMAALALFCKAAKKDEADAVETRRLVAYLYRARSNPLLHFSRDGQEGAPTPAPLRS